jgi:hypothetical protein
LTPQLDDDRLPRRERERAVDGVALAVAAGGETYGAAIAARLDGAAGEVQRDHRARSAPERPRSGRSVEQLVVALVKIA